MKNNIHTIRAYFVGILLFLYTGLPLISRPLHLANGVDGSWNWAINYIANSSNIIWGKDVFFTYGPLGFTIIPFDLGNLFLISQIIKIMVWLSFFGFFIFWIKNQGENFSKKFLLWSIIWAYLMYLNLDIPFEWQAPILLVCTLFTFLKLNDKNIFAKQFLPIMASFLTLFCLLFKFTNAAISIVFILLFLPILWFQKREYFKTYCINYFSSTAVLLTFAIATIFKGLSNFINWFTVSIEISKGYNEAMVINGSIIALNLALITCSILLLFLFYLYRDDKKSFFQSLIVLPLIFILYKHGFVRQDQDAHSYIFFTIIPYLFGILFLNFNCKKYIKYFVVLVSATIFCHIYLVNIGTIYSSLYLLALFIGLASWGKIQKYIQTEYFEKIMFFLLCLLCFYGILSSPYNNFTKIQLTQNHSP